MDVYQLSIGNCFLRNETTVFPPGVSDSHRPSATVDGRHPAHQLRLVVHPIIYKVLAPSQVVGLGISEASTSYHFSPEDVGSS